MTKPVHKHDFPEECKHCEWLGTLQLPNELGQGPYDLYYCGNHLGLIPGTVIARWGVGADYISGMQLAEMSPMSSEGSGIDSLRVAWLIARDLAYAMHVGSLKRENV